MFTFQQVLNFHAQLLPSCLEFLILRNSMWSYILEDDSPAWIRLKRKGRKRRKGNVHAGFSYVKPDGGVERPSSEENESRREDGGGETEGAVSS